jgi:hypothetical protein
MGSGQWAGMSDQFASAAEVFVCSLSTVHCFSLFADVFVPDFGVGGDIGG